MSVPQQTRSRTPATRGVVYGAGHGLRAGGRRVTVFGCGLSAEEAGATADSAGQALSTLARESARLSPLVPLEVPPERLLLRGDFAPEAEVEEDGSAAAVRGALTGLRYAVPADVVLRNRTGRAESPRRFVGTVHVPTRERRRALTGRAVAQVLATDIAVRWWQRPRTQLIRLDAHRLLPEAVSASGTSSLLTDLPVGRECPHPRVEAFLWPDQPFSLVLAVVHGGSAGFGVAAGAGPRAALREALLSSHTARMYAALRADVAAHLALLHGNSRRPRPGDVLPGDVPGDTGCGPSPDWFELAGRRFGHEPLVASFTASDGGQVVCAVCPGAIVHRPFARHHPACPL